MATHGLPCSRDLLPARYSQNFIEERMEAANENDYFTVTLYQMDIERVRYSLSRYLRTRCVSALVLAVFASLQQSGLNVRPPAAPQPGC